MFSFFLIIAVLSQADAACNEGDEIRKVMKLDGSPACRHCRCWRTVEWVCVVERSACKWPVIKYSNDDQQLALEENQQRDPKQNRERYYKLQMSNANKGCYLGDQIVKKMTIGGSQTCLRCECWGTVEWDCEVLKGPCPRSVIKSDVCSRTKLSNQKMLLHNKEQCYLCSCKYGNFICSQVHQGSENVLDKEACEFSSAGANTAATTRVPGSKAEEEKEENIKDPPTEVPGSKAEEEDIKDPPTEVPGSKAEEEDIKDPPTEVPGSKSEEEEKEENIKVPPTEVSAISPFKEAEFTQTGKKKYYLVTWLQAEWHEAKEYCHNYGLQLATIMSKTENNYLVRYIEKMDYREDRFWTSGTNLPAGGEYYWEATGQPLTYTNWGPDEPNNAHREGGEEEHCLEIVHYNSRYVGIQWNDFRCSLRSYFVCETK